MELRSKAARMHPIHEFALVRQRRTDEPRLLAMSISSPHYPLLVIDTSSRTTWVGLKLAPDTLIARSETQDPSKSLFALIDRVLAESERELSEIGSIAYCEGPGSMLGARTTAMTLRTWQAIGLRGASNLFTYNSLHGAAILAEKSADCPDAGVVLTDARRSSWNALAFPTDPDSTPSLVPNESLAAETRPCVTFEDFPSWTKTEKELIRLTYRPLEAFADTSLYSYLRPVETATPLTVRSNDFKKWEAKIHTAPKP